MQAQTFERHPLDSRVLISENIADIQHVDGRNFKAGFVTNAADAELADNLIAIPDNAIFLAKPIRAFMTADEAQPELKKFFSESSLDRLGLMSRHFGTASGKDTTRLCITRNLGRILPATQKLHFEGRNPFGPSTARVITGNLSVTNTGKDQLRWIPADDLSEADIRAILDPAVIDKPKYTFERAASGTLGVFWGLDVEHPNLRTDGLLHGGPLILHPRTTVQWGALQADY